jgi:hypothetical protein
MFFKRNLPPMFKPLQGNGDVIRRKVVPALLRQNNRRKKVSLSAHLFGTSGSSGSSDTRGSSSVVAFVFIVVVGMLGSITGTSAGLIMTSRIRSRLRVAAPPGQQESLLQPVHAGSTTSYFDPEQWIRYTPFSSTEKSLVVCSPGLELLKKYSSASA